MGSLVKDVPGAVSQIQLLHSIAWYAACAQRSREFASLVGHGTRHKQRAIGTYLIRCDEPSDP